MEKIKMEMDEATRWFKETVIGWVDAKTNDPELGHIYMLIPAVISNEVSLEEGVVWDENGVLTKSHIEKWWNALIRKYARTQVEKDFHFGVPRKNEKKIKDTIHAVIDYLKERGFCLISIEEALVDA